jgi:NAD(P)-dependent dehydrogenase (short-subunit alcohol dehydrogenase family)
MSDLNGDVILVLGASGDLGSRLASVLTAAGATVVHASRSTGHDLRDVTMPSRILATIHQEHGRLDGVVIAAGVVAFGSADTLSDATLNELFDVNALGPIRVIREATPLLAESSRAGGHPFIVTLSGIVSEVPTAGLAAYSASKSALAAFAVAASRELRRSGIRILDARPGHTETSLSQHPIAGTPPAFGPGLDPDVVVARIVRAISDDERDLPSTAFAE